MGTTNGLIATSATPLTLTRDADGLRLGALILSTLDRAGVAGQVLGRCVIYSRRVAVFELPGLNYALATVLVEQCGWGLHLSNLIGVAHTLMLARRPTGGSVVIVDLLTDQSNLTRD